jgi:hypothetical protein
MSRQVRQLQSNVFNSTGRGAAITHRPNMRLSSIRPSFRLFLLPLILCLPQQALGNAAAPSQGGSAGAEPTGLEQIFILRESLNIDLRQLGEAEHAEGRAILVEAIYELENRGAERRVDLVFAFGSGYKDFSVWLDDQPVATRPAQLKDQPQSWKIPRTTPWLKGGQLDYAPGDRPLYGQSSQAFSPTIPPGRHRLRAGYMVAPTRFASSPIRYWQFAYILAPAREWAGFGGLDVTVSAPKGWTVVTSPGLGGGGGVLKGSFDHVPADALALTAQAPLPLYYDLANLSSGLLFLLALLAGPVALIFLAWRRGYRLRRSWLYGIGAALLWSLLVGATGLLYDVGAGYTVPPDQYSGSGYGEVFLIFGVLLAAALAFPIGLALWLLTAYLARKRKAVR